MPYEIHRFPYEGAVDADGHVLEPPNLWEEYLEKKHSERAIRIRRDEDGFEYLEIDGKPHNAMVRGVLGVIACIEDDLSQVVPSPERTYTSNQPYGAGDPGRRLDLLDQENLQATALYPTLGLLWESHCTDPELATAYSRAYNRWIADFCRNSGGRLLPVAHVSLLDPEAAAVELERAVKDGCRGVFLNSRTHLNPATGAYRPHGHPFHDPFFAKAQELDVPVAIHVSNPFPWDVTWWADYRKDVGAPHAAVREFDADRPAAFIFDLLSLGLVYGVQRAFLSFFSNGTLERFPRLRVGVLEAGAGWIAAFLERLDGMYKHVSPVPNWSGVGLKHPPSYYFERQCYISAEPDETSTTLIMEHVGTHKFMWATDYPHHDHPESWVPELAELVAPMEARKRERLIGGTAREFYGLR